MDRSVRLRLAIKRAFTRPQFAYAAGGGVFWRDAMTIKDYLASIGAKGGKVKSAAKAAAVRANGKKGGRPRKTPKK